MSVLDLFRLDGKTALVTGAKRGMGRSMAVALADAGADVIGVSATLELNNSDVEREVHSLGRQFTAYACDFSDGEAVYSLVERLQANHPTIDILVNNAGLERDARFDEMTLEQWNTVIAINLTGQFLCAREAEREFLRRGVVPDVSSAAGKIICMSSVHEVIPWGGHVNYAASKGGVMQLMKSMAQELAPKKIRVNSIAPGAIKTPINRTAWETPEAERELLKLIPEGRVGVPADIARAAVWLASDASDYVTGTTIFVDGGMTLYPGFATGG